MAERDDIEDILPLTPMQEMMLFQHELDRSRGDYWNLVEFEFGGRLDPQRWRASWASGVSRFPLLRTRFRRDGKGKALQIVLRDDELDWHQLDLTAIDTERRSHELESFRATLGLPPDLRHDAPLRLGLARTGESSWIFTLRYHHIVLDGWSEQAMLQAAFREYEGKPAEAEVEAPPFGAFVRWIAEQDRDAGMAFWQSYLDGAEPVTDRLPLREVGALDEFRADLDEVALSSLQRMTRETRVTRSSILGAVWALTMAAETGCTDLVIGQIASLRSPPFERTAGPLIATLPLRYRTDTAQPLAGWLQRQQQDLQLALRHVAVSVAEMQPVPGRDGSGGVLFALFGYEAAAERSWRTDAFSVEGVRRAGATGLPLSLVVQDEGDRLQFILSFAEAAYTRAAVERIFARFQYLLQMLIDAAAMPLNRLCLLLPGEVPAGVEVSDAATLPTVPELVFDAAARYPQREAIVVDGHTMTYSELQSRARRFAAGFASRGIGAGDRLGLFVRRGRDLIPAIIGLWLVGAVYLPFDPGHPLPRIRAAARKAGLRNLLVDAATAPAAAAIGDLELIRIDTAASAAAADHAPRCAATEVAYLIFTSGSTGVPNGVPIRHAGLSNLLLDLQREPGFSATDAMLAATTVAFDISLVELLLPICAGGTVHLATDEQLLDPGIIAGMIRDSAISVQFATPALWENLLLAGWQGKPGLCCWVGGDRLRTDLAQRLQQQADSLWNLYGPTETAICSTLGPVTDAGNIDIGGPVANTEVLIVDRAGRVLPPGVKGELLIGGVGVSPGYVNNPELTAERFVERDGRRYFRSGDLALRRESGAVVHFGRVDRQIKLRGFRIEPGEIESALNRVAGIESSYVMLGRVDGDPRLLAYVGETREGAAADALRDVLPRQLPAYMVPAAVVSLAELPLSASGKVDQRALPAPERAPGRDASVAGAAEQALAELWESLLGCPVQSADDDFLALGGHSLLLARLSVLIQQRFNIRVSIRALMSATRLSEQAKLLEGDSTGAAVATEYGFLPLRKQLFYAWHPAARRPLKGAVLLVPPLLNHMTRTRLLYRELALRLQGLGYAAFRFDPAGHGNSAADPSSIRLDDWLEDIREAGNYARGRLAQAQWSVVSARFGSALATAALADFGVREWVTLDPIYSGSEWLRELERWRDAQMPALRACLSRNEYQGFELGQDLLAELARFSTPPRGGERRICSSADENRDSIESGDFNVGWQQDDLQHIISTRLVQALVEPFA